MAVYSTEEDRKLLELFNQPGSKESAYTSIIKKYQEKLYWHIRRMLVGHADTDDVLQNVLVKAWKGLENFREDSQLYTWLYRIATNESLTFIEKRKRNASISIDDMGSYLENKLQAEDGFDPQKLEWKLQMAIQQLPEKQKVVFSLRYFDEMKYAEMSQVLQTSEGALKASYHHAAKKIEEYLLSN